MRRIFFVLALFLAGFSMATNAVAAPISLSDLQKRVSAGLMATGKVAKVKIRADGCLDIWVKDGKDSSFSCLDNAMARIDAGYEPDAVVEDFVLGLTDAMAGAKPQFATLRPVLRATETIRAYDAQMAQGPNPVHIVSMPFAADIAMTFVFDTPHGMRFMSDSDAKELGVATKDILPRAVENFRADAKRVEWKPIGRTLLAVLDDNYESSLLLVDEVWVDVERRLGGPIIATIPARNTLVAVRADDAESVALLRQFAADDFPYPISAVLLRRENGKWVEVK